MLRFNAFSKSLFFNTNLNQMEIRNESVEVSIQVHISLPATMFKFKFIKFIFFSFTILLHQSKQSGFGRSDLCGIRDDGAKYCQLISKLLQINLLDYFLTLSLEWIFLSAFAERYFIPNCHFRNWINLKYIVNIISIIFYLQYKNWYKNLLASQWLFIYFY